ncbi:MAG: 2-hydroxyacid dehydrogenase [Dehalococcoidia bacterium]
MKKAVFADIGVFSRLESDPLAEIVEARYHYDTPDANTLAQRCRDVHIVVWGWGSITNEIIDSSPNIEMICYLGVGAGGQIDLQYAKSKGITVCNTPHYGDLAVAEHGVALMMASARKVVQADRSIHKGQWESFGGIELRGATMGIVGLGGVGVELAVIGNALGMNVICYTRRPSPERAEKHKVRFVNLDELMSTSDYVQMAQVLNDETQGMIGEQELGRMKKEAYLINVARGQVVDQAALLKALKENRIAGYATDVFEEDPVKKEPLLELDNVIATPHIAFDTPGAKKKMLEIAIDNVRAYMEGKPQNVLVP